MESGINLVKIDGAKSVKKSDCNGKDRFSHTISYIKFYDDFYHRLRQLSQNRGSGKDFIAYGNVKVHGLGKIYIQP